MVLQRPSLLPHFARADADIREMSAVIWIDRIEMGDDIDAPHECVVRLSAGAPVANLVSEIRRTNYPARVAGGLATWIVEGKQPVAVLAQQWSEPRWLVDSEVSIAALGRETGRATSKYSTGAKSIRSGCMHACVQGSLCPTDTDVDAASVSPLAVEQSRCSG
jgi:hypothetical protein